jgi:hypothetical protein
MTKKKQATGSTKSAGANNSKKISLNQDLFAQHWLVNTLLDDNFIVQKAKELSESPIPYGLEDWLTANFDPALLAARSEAQLEEKFIGPMLYMLGWSKVSQETITVQGKLAKPDWCLLTEPQLEAELISSKDHTLITAICESKAWGKVLDTGKADRKDNPHHQLQDYLSTLRVRFGFLTNGRIWRVYDTNKITAKKTFIEFDLEKLWLDGNEVERTKGLALFAFFFGRNTYVKPEGDAKTTVIEQAISESHDLTLEVEENLKAVIYGYAGEDSLFEIMGKAIQKASPKADLTSVYENSVVLLFRLLFVVYFEDKNRSLLEIHPFYKNYSLLHIFQSLGLEEPNRDALHDGVFALKRLFEMIDAGAEDIDIPLFNGGLFDPDRAPLLLTPKIFDNSTLRVILEKLLFKTRRGETLFDTRRDFKNMSVTHLGRIYEGLLEFSFERASESAVYLEYSSTATKGKTVEAYFDDYDFQKIKKEKGFRPLREISVKKGDVYLKSANNSRKSTASFYTPSVLSKPLVKASVDHAVSVANASGKALMELKILDNACGSGHFLVEALGYVTDLALAQLDEDQDLQQLVVEERKKIAQQLKALNLDYEPEDAQILKRALLKRCIFGVDLNPFAVELARLSLWMDSFVFGTPLSFIEHHVQHGNALMGASVQDFIDYNATEVKQDDLFVENLSAKFDDLRNVMHELDAMRDTTAIEVERSKELWKKSIEPKLSLLSRALSFICTRRAMIAEGEIDACRSLDKTPDLLTQLFGEGKSKSAALKIVESYAARYRFFHYEVAFPEAFARDKKGFDIVVGNPPWDKTKFFDSEFFAQYHSNYRSLKNTEKATVQARLMESPYIAEMYKKTQRAMEIANEYYKDKAVFPLNKGGGDGNLFRYFVERNLGLLAKNGTLNYVLPSALMFEEGSMALRKHIFSNCVLSFFYSFENRLRIFSDVHASYKFAMMQIIKSNPGAEATSVVDSAFYLLRAEELEDKARHIPYSLETVKALSPNQWALMELRDTDDLPVLKKCYEAFPPLSPEWLDFRRELHMTDDKALFLEQKVSGSVPLYEGKMIWQFSNTFEQPQYWLDPKKFDKAFESKELHRMAQDLAVSKAEAGKFKSAVRYDREFIRLGFRDIASDTNERTLIFSLIPKGCGVGNTLHINVPKKYVRSADGHIAISEMSPIRLLFAMAWFNSLPVDWLARFMIQIHANKTYLFRLPTPQPEDEEILSNESYATLAKNALLLSLKASWDDFCDLAAVFNVSANDVPTSSKAEDILRAQNDKLVAKLLGLDNNEFAYLARSFTGLASKRPEYMTLLA